LIDMNIKIIGYFFVFVLLSCLVIPALAEDSPDIKIPEICVSGIMFDEEKPLAVINGQISWPGELVEGASVLEIDDSFVRFEYKGKVFDKELSDKCNKGPEESFYKKVIPEGLLSKRDRAKKPKQADKKIKRYLPLMIKEETSAFEDLMRMLAVNPRLKALILWSALIVFIIYGYLAVALQKIASKTNVKNGWLAWIPVGNLYLMCVIAKRPGWWLLFLLIPLLNILMMIIVWAGIARVRKKPAWLGIFIIVPVVNLLAIGYLAFSK